MNNGETIKWLESLKAEIGKSEHRTLWHYAEAIDMAIEALQTEPVTYTFDVKSDKCEECAYKKTVEELSKGFEDYIIHGERREP